MSSRVMVMAFGLVMVLSLASFAGGVPYTGVVSIDTVDGHPGQSGCSPHQADQ